MAETPVIIGVGDIKNRSTAVADAKEPATLMLAAIQRAIQDASPTSASELQAAIDSIDIVKTWTWPYPDLPGLLAEKLGVEKSIKWKRYSDHGGDKPGKLFDEAAKRIAKGECKVAVVTGGEALASRAYYHHLLHLANLHFSKTYQMPRYLTTTSIRLRRRQKAPSTQLDNTLPSRRFRFHADREGPWE
jgi:acetyl-CoA acetyltransferase